MWLPEYGMSLKELVGRQFNEWRGFGSSCRASNRDSEGLGEHHYQDHQHHRPFEEPRCAHGPISEGGARFRGDLPLMRCSKISAAPTREERDVMRLSRAARERATQRPASPGNQSEGRQAVEQAEDPC